MSMRVTSSKRTPMRRLPQRRSRRWARSRPSTLVLGPWPEPASQALLFHQREIGQRFNFPVGSNALENERQFDRSKPADEHFAIRRLYALRDAADRKRRKFSGFQLHDWHLGDTRLHYP